MRNEVKNKIFTIVQEYLKDPPLVVWGSGATIPYGMPSMSDLNRKLGEKINNFDVTNNNLEQELGKDKYKSEFSKIKEVIWDTIDEANNKILNDIISNRSKYECVKQLIDKIKGAHPKVMTIVTTNYDKVLEYIMSYNKIRYTDGFNDKDLSEFDDSLFCTKEDIVNLIKVHGSLNWFKENDNIRYLTKKMDKMEPLIIPPGKNKYRDAYDKPYRELIQKSDSYIESAKSFLVVGFGFNDEHLTPKIRERVNEGIPIVVITKKVTKSTKEELKQAKKYVMLEKMSEKKTKIAYTHNGKENEQEVEIIGDYWQLPNFMEII
jgi:hypothetical protein